MEITIDGNTMSVSDANKNIVDIAKENGINIISPCYGSNHEYGCCHACIIEVSGLMKYACCTKPEDGMQVLYNREDLAAKRKVNLKKYAEKVMSGIPDKNGCCCGDDDSGCGCSTENNEDSCCGDDSGSGCCGSGSGCGCK